MADCKDVQSAGVGPSKVLLQVSGLAGVVRVLYFVVCSNYLILSNYSSLVARGSVDDKNRVLTVALTEYVFMVGATFAVIAKDLLTLWYQTVNPLLNDFSTGLLFCLF